MKENTNHEAVVIAPHHLHHEEEQRVAQEIDNRRTAIKSSSASQPESSLSADYAKPNASGFLSRPGPVVTFIVIAAVIFISIIAWLIAHEPVK
jgi:hypothetical protein